MTNFKTPILFIVFNRIETAKRVFEAIREVQPSTLFIAADGPRIENDEDILKCEIVRDFVTNNIDWKCDVKTLFNDKNLGCGRGPATAITWFFNHVEEGIILEDDCVPNITFFEYCEILLEKYRNDTNISIISGANFDTNFSTLKSSNSYFLSVFPFTWGWATWKRNWVDFDFNIKKWGEINKRNFLKFLFDDIEYQLAWKKIFDNIYAQPPADIWDYQFFFASFLKKQHSIVPSVNLVTNIGFGSDATHTIDTDSEFTNVIAYSFEFPIEHSRALIRNISYDTFLQNANYGSVKSDSLQRKFKNWIKSIIKKR